MILVDTSVIADILTKDPDWFELVERSNRALGRSRVSHGGGRHITGHRSLGLRSGAPDPLYHAGSGPALRPGLAERRFPKRLKPNESNERHEMNLRHPASQSGAALESGSRKPVWKPALRPVGSPREP